MRYADAVLDILPDSLCAKGVRSAPMPSGPVLHKPVLSVVGKTFADLVPLATSDLLKHSMKQPALVHFMVAEAEQGGMNVLLLSGWERSIRHFTDVV